MRIRPEAFRQEDKIREEVKAVEEEMKPDVIWIRWHFGQDWKEEWGIYFKVLLSDDAAEHRLREVSEKVEKRIEERLDFEDLEIFDHFNYRSESGQAKLREESWA